MSNNEQGQQQYQQPHQQSHLLALITSRSWLWYSSLCSSSSRVFHLRELMLLEFSQ